MSKFYCSVCEEEKESNLDGCHHIEDGNMCNECESLPNNEFFIGSMNELNIHLNSDGKSLI